MVLYYKEILGLTPKKRSEKLYEFCEKNIPNYKKAKYYKVINKALSYGSKKGQKLVSIDKVDISKLEVNYINALDLDDNCKKVLFAFLVQMKLNKIIYEYKNEKPYTGKYFKGGKIKYNNIKKMANIPSSVNINDDIIHILDRKKIVKILHNGLIRLDFLNDCVSDGDVVIEVKNFENVGWYLDYYNGEKGIILCKYCKQPFKKTNSNMKYCNEHKGYQPIETKIIKCVDCGKEIAVDSKANNKDRCDNCYKVYRNNYQKELMREKRNLC